jgi:hypothetical protein
METVKVDIQKLQLLNDRIAQTIEALNQVRLSMHGIQHSSSPVGVSPYGGYSPYGYGQPQFAQPSFGQPSFGQPSFGQPSFAQPFSPFGQGLSHTTAPWTTTTTPWMTGIAHTSWDPMWQVRQVPYIY